MNKQEILNFIGKLGHFTMIIGEYKNVTNKLINDIIVDNDIIPSEDIWLLHGVLKEDYVKSIDFSKIKLLLIRDLDKSNFTSTEELRKCYDIFKYMVVETKKYNCKIIIECMVDDHLSISDMNGRYLPPINSNTNGIIYLADYILLTESVNDDIRLRIMKHKERSVGQYISIPNDYFNTGNVDMERIQKILDQERELMAKHGWIIHYVSDAFNDYPEYISAHTHGLKEKYGQSDLEIVISLDQKTVSSILHNIVDKIYENNIVITQDGPYEGIINNYPIYFINTTDNLHDPSRSVCRVIFPDSNGRFPDDEKCDEYYKNQLKVTR